MHRGMKDENYSLHPYDCEKKKKKERKKPCGNLGKNWSNNE